ncbi:ATPase [Sphingobacteriaceae bacterium]|nr:ATPase [Sphingobacteriaceae bacterium]
MIEQNQTLFPDFTKSLSINAPVSKVWQTITLPERIEKWLLDDKVKVTTDWTIGNTLTIEVLEHWVLSKTTGKVLAVESERLLRYTQLSSLSRLPDELPNHCILEFRLETIENKTRLIFTARNFPTESIYKHMVFYWNTTLEVIKQLAEGIEI